MKPKILVSFLVGSLLMNGFFVAGFAYSQYRLKLVGSSPSARNEAIARRLELDEAQRVVLRLIRDEVRKTVGQYKRRDAQALQRYWQIMAHAEPDQAQLDRVIEQMAQNQKAYHQGLSGHMIKFLAALDEKQQETFLRIAREKNIFRALVRRP